VKIVLIIDDEAYAWVLDETGRCWECWVEDGDQPAQRMMGWDCYSTTKIHEHIQNMVIEQQNSLVETDK